jgi:superfamily II DNA/RNA helicase
VEHARRMADVINRYRPKSARSIDGSAAEEERERMFAAFHEREFQFLCNCELLLEGYDEPHIGCVAMARPTKSKTLYCQAVGRGTRLLGDTLSESIENGKPDLLLLDFVGNSGKHNLICGLDIIDGNEDAEVRARAVERVKKGGAKNILDALRDAENELANERKAEILTRVNYRVSSVDPFAILGIHPRAGRWGGIAPSAAQRDVLLRNGFTEDQISRMDKGQCSDVISAIAARRETNQCTLRQAKVLARAGIDPKGITYELASEIVTALKANNWRATPSIRAIPQRAKQRQQEKAIEDFWG